MNTQLATTKSLAEMIMSDCGYSSEYTPLLNRIINRIEAYDQQQRCYCGNIYRLGVVHREDSFCDEHPRKPLAEELIGNEFVRFEVGKGDYIRFLYAVRAIEAAHGIKE